MAEQYLTAKTFGRLEHWITILGGGALIVHGLARRSLGGTLLALLGGDLIYHELAHEDVHIHQVYGFEVPRAPAPVETAPQPEGIRIQRSVTIDRPTEDLYRFWRNWENLPRVFDYLRSVRAVDNTRSHWIAKSGDGVPIEWDAVITEDVPNQLISWRSLQGSSVSNSGSIHFTKSPNGRGTRMNITVEYDPAAGPVYQAFVKLLGDAPSQTLREQLSRLKQFLETDRTGPKRSTLKTILES